MTGVIIFVTLAIFISPGYIVWPSRYNVVTHLTIGGNFISTFVPAIILGVYDRFPNQTVELYTNILLVGCAAFLIGLISGFNVKRLNTNYTFNILEERVYDKRVIKLTQILMIVSICFLIISYIGMGFIPAFTADPLAAKFFRGPYQAPYKRVAILFRSSFFILSTILPIAGIIWYKTKSKFFFVSTIVAVTLMALSLSRSPAFSGLILAFAIVMSFKSRFHFRALLVLVIAVYLLSSVFYFVVGARNLDLSNYDNDHPYWSIVGQSSPDISDHLLFINKYIQKPSLTYGRTVYGGLIPGHYEWNPGVYTLTVLATGEDLDDIVSGGLRLPVYIWGYVSFGWTGVFLFSIISGFFYGYFLKSLKLQFNSKSSLITKTVLVVIFNIVFSNFYYFYLLSIYYVPATIIMLFYMYRIKLK